MNPMAMHYCLQMWYEKPQVFSSWILIRTIVIGEEQVS